ncbi:unnamed protein product [Effrenium voratum]|nr:unnamed protein product [Effrenium voratum]
MNWTEAPWRMCARLRAKTMARWLEELQASDFSPEIFSVFWRREKSLQWIEPLAATLRHPATHCQGHWQRSAAQRGYEFDWKELRRTFESKDYLLLSKSAWADKGQRILFDAGVNAYNSSLGWFLDAYARNGILFDRLFGWEVSPPAHFLEQIPAEVAQRLRFSTEPVVSTEAHENNPVALISKLCRPQDFCVLKLDIDEPETERELFGQLIRSPGDQQQPPGITITTITTATMIIVNVDIVFIITLPAWSPSGSSLDWPFKDRLLDEFFWEDHVDLPAYGLFGGKGTLEESYQRFLLLRPHATRATRATRADAVRRRISWAAPGRGLKLGERTRVDPWMVWKVGKVAARYEHPGLICDFEHLCHQAIGADWIRIQNVVGQGEWSEWIPYKNVTEWKVYAGTPVLVQYHAGTSSSYVLGDCVQADGARCYAGWHAEMYLRSDFNGWGLIQDGRMSRVNHFTWALNITLSRFSRAKFAPHQAPAASRFWARPIQ